MSEHRRCFHSAVCKGMYGLHVAGAGFKAYRLRVVLKRCGLYIADGWLHLDDVDRPQLSGTHVSQPRQLRESPYVREKAAPRRKTGKGRSRAKEGAVGWGWGEEELGLALGSTARQRAGAVGERITARHQWTLRSAYAAVAGAEPSYTSYHEKFCGTVDYMWCVLTDTARV